MNEQKLRTKFCIREKKTRKIAKLLTVSLAVISALKRDISASFFNSAVSSFLASSVTF
jgi:hypothetical protein